MEAEKTCKKCGAERPAAEFYKNPTLKDGRDKTCKDCRRREDRERYWTDPDSARARGREKHSAKRPEEVERSRRYYEDNREAAAERNRRWRQANPDRHKNADPVKAAARRAVIDAVRSGKLVKPGQCEDCGNAVEKRLLHGHHHDYSKPLEVEWLCSGCHGKRHRTEGVAS